MSDTIVRRTTCRMCDGRDLEVVLQLAPTPIGDAYVPLERVDRVQESYPLDLFLCHECGLSQLLDVINPDILYGEYLYVTSISLGLPEHFRGYADDVLARIRPPIGGLVIDLGSNDGTLLRSFQSRGMRVLGVDPAREIAARATQSGIETLAVFFTPELSRRIRKDYGPASIVTANNVFANVDDLAGFTEGVRELLAPDGVFVFESFYLADMIQNMVFDFIYHEHLSYYSVRPLVSFFRQMGMELIDVQRVSTKGGSLRCSVQRTGGPRAISPSVAEMAAIEASLNIDRPEAFKAFAGSIEGAKSRLLDLLHDLETKGKKIAGYGAAVGVTTLIYHFGLSGFLSFMVDDNSMRHNLFSPGCHLPVLAPQLLYERKPAYVLVLAWRYAVPIMRRHQAYLNQGGHFIAPLPEMRVW